MEKRKKVELLAPAGGPQAFYGAVGAGADAVYLGGEKFGARAYAENFKEDELTACVRYGRLSGIKVYLTINTLFRERELDELQAYLAPLCDAGLSGVIVQDPGVLVRVRKAFPGLALHASTQMALCTEWGAELVKEMGASRIVPARELGLAELKSLKSRSGLEIEAFVHGAMCYCYSGQCLFSSMLGGRSGNRGRCAQPCRLPYRVKSGTKGEKGRQCYPLSLKDMCTVWHIPALVEAGIDSFKIEGRMKKPEYAAGVTAVYRKYIDEYFALRESLGSERAQEAFQVSEEDEKILASLYVRSGLQDGYYFRKNGREMVSVDSPAYNGADGNLLERLRSAYLKERPRLDVEMEAEFLAGMPAKILLHRGGITAQAIGESVQTAKNRPMTEEALRSQLDRLGDSPFSISGMRLRVSGQAFYPLKEINRLRRQAVQAMEKALEESQNGCNGLKTGENQPEFRIAMKRPTESMEGEGNRLDESIKGGEPKIRLSGNCGFQKAPDARQCRRPGWAVFVRTLDQLKALAENLAGLDGESGGREKGFRLDRLYVDGDLLLRKGGECRRLFERLVRPAPAGRADEGPKLLAALPFVVRQSDRDDLGRLWELAQRGIADGFLARSLDGLGFMLERERESGKRVCLRADAGVYAWNSAAAETLSAVTDGLCLPYELNAPQQGQLLEKTSGRDGAVSWEKVVYGRIPLMVTANCIQNTTDRCIGEGEGVLWLEDRFHTEFPALRNCAHCYNVIYNSVPLSLLGNAERFRDKADLRLDFTLEDGKELAGVLRSCLRGVPLAAPYTTGHEKRGVE